MLAIAPLAFRVLALSPLSFSSFFPALIPPNPRSFSSSRARNMEMCAMCSPAPLPVQCPSRARVYARVCVTRACASVTSIAVRPGALIVSGEYLVARDLPIPLVSITGANRTARLININYVKANDVSLRRIQCTYISGR